jgi:hypothetical protein
MAGFSPCNVSLEWTPSQVIAELPEQKRDVYSRKLDELPVLIAANVNIFECEFVATARS